MRMRILLHILLLFAASQTIPARDLFIYPGLYATWGEYDDNSTVDDDFSSREFSAYLTISNNDRHFFSAGVSDAHQFGTGWVFDQQFYIAALRTQRYPYNLLAAFGYMHGQLDFNYEFEIPTPPMTGHLYAAELQRHVGKLLAGFQAHTYRQSTFDKHIAQTFALRSYYPVTSFIGLQMMPGYTWGNRDQRLEFLSGEFYLQPHRKLLLTLGGLLGERLFAFDHNLLVLDNQGGNLESRVFCKLRYRLTSDLSLTGELIRSEYESYAVDYLVLGLSMRKLVHS